MQLSNPQASTQAALASSKAREHHELLLCNKSAARVATAPPAGCCWVAKGHGNAAAGEAEGIPSLSPPMRPTRSEHLFPSKRRLAGWWPPPNAQVARRPRASRQLAAPETSAPKSAASWHIRSSLSARHPRVGRTFSSPSVPPWGPPPSPPSPEAGRWQRRGSTAC